MSRLAGKLTFVLVATAVSAAAGSPPADEAATFALRIDEMLAARQAELGVEPAPIADDAEFLRRVYLDLTGVIPPAGEAREFLADEAPNKRRRLVDRLLDSPGYAVHMANTWRGLMLPAGFEGGNPASVAALQDWLRRQFAENARYDRMVADVITAAGGQASDPAAFIAALEYQPEKLASETARIFLGLQIGCAECHDHPFDKWSQQEFWGYAAFFSEVTAGEMSGPFASRVFDQEGAQVTLPNTEQVVARRFPDATPLDDAAGGTRRRQLAIWLTSPENPYLAPAAANWAWAHLFGRGLVFPTDDIGPHNPASHPQLFAELAESFRRSGYDVKQLLRTIVSTEAYQRTSRQVDQPPPREAFAVAAVRPLTADQLFDSIARALQREVEPVYPGAPAAASFDARRMAFTARMKRTSRDATEYDAGAQQALMLLNGPDTAAAVSEAQGALLAALSAPFFTDDGRIDALFLATLSRPPAPDERERMLSYVRSAGGAGDESPLGDVLWALLNSAEFATNH